VYIKRSQARLKLREDSLLADEHSGSKNQIRGAFTGPSASSTRSNSFQDYDREEMSHCDAGSNSFSLRKVFLK
jgi:hypothetical protein